ncbi:response regulator transcription factor [Nocardia rhamnosiphila]
MIRVVVVDDQHLVREGLRALLERAADIEVVGVAGTGTAGLSVVRRTRPNVVLMDIRMPGGDGLSATRQIVVDPALRKVGVIVLTTFDTDDNILEAVRAGAAGFLLKDTDPDELRAAVRIVAGGEALLAPAVTRRVMRAAAHAAGPSPRAAALLERLTPRELEVLLAVGSGRSNAEIGAALHMSPATARTHIGRLLDKLEARDRANLVAIAYETGLIVPGSRSIPCERGAGTPG